MAKTRPLLKKVTIAEPETYYTTAYTAVAWRQDWLDKMGLKVGHDGGLILCSLLMKEKITRCLVAQSRQGKGSYPVIDEEDLLEVIVGDNEMKAIIEALSDQRRLARLWRAYHKRMQAAVQIRAELTQ